MRLFINYIHNCFNQLIDYDCKRNIEHIKTQFEHMELVFKDIISVFNQLIPKRKEQVAKHNFNT